MIFLSQQPHPGPTVQQPSAMSSTELDIPIAPGKTFPPSTSLEFMGILLDSHMMEARLPQDKLGRTKQALACSAGVLLGRVSVTTLRPPF